MTSFRRSNHLGTRFRLDGDAVDFERRRAGEHLPALHHPGMGVWDGPDAGLRPRHLHVNQVKPLDNQFELLPGPLIHDHPSR